MPRGDGVACSYCDTLLDFDDGRWRYCLLPVDDAAYDPSSEKSLRAERDTSPSVDHGLES